MENFIGVANMRGTLTEDVITDDHISITEVKVGKKVMLLEALNVQAKKLKHFKKGDTIIFQAAVSLKRLLIHHIFNRSHHV